MSKNNQNMRDVMRENDEIIKKNILDLVETAKKMNEHIDAIEKNLLIAHDAFEHAGRVITQSEMDKLVNGADVEY